MISQPSTTAKRASAARPGGGSNSRCESGTVVADMCSRCSGGADTCAASLQTPESGLSLGTCRAGQRTRPEALEGKPPTEPRRTSAPGLGRPAATSRAPPTSSAAGHSASRLRPSSHRRRRQPRLPSRQQAMRSRSPTGPVGSPPRSTLRPHNARRSMQWRRLPGCDIQQPQVAQAKRPPRRSLRPRRNAPLMMRQSPWRGRCSDARHLPEGRRCSIGRLCEAA